MGKTANSKDIAHKSRAKLYWINSRVQVVTKIYPCQNFFCKLVLDKNKHVVLRVYIWLCTQWKFLVEVGNPGMG